ncbi:MAG: SRPBCC family protein [Deltaproteobacteria bacterium]|nr:SRPBCC family protein [Deltaproteobacteria bacterium]
MTHKTTIHAPIEQVFSFFSQPQNLGVMTPAAMQFRIVGTMPNQLSRDQKIDYPIQLGPIPLRWRTCIERWEPPYLFGDSQESGPYSCWWHEHHFAPEQDRTLMEDRVYYAPPLGPLGEIANALFVAPAPRTIFVYRTQAMRFRFPDKRITPIELAFDC